MPHFDTINLPEKKVKNVTQAEPFLLETDKRGAYKTELWKHQVGIGAAGTGWLMGV